MSASFRPRGDSQMSSHEAYEVGVGLGVGLWLGLRRTSQMSSHEAYEVLEP